MKRSLASVVALLFLFTGLHAQKAELYARRSDNGLYIEHKVVPKESYFSVGRLYNLSPKTIAEFNKADINKGIFIDQKLRIPLTDSNFTQSGNKGTPVYYRAGDKIALSKVSQAYNLSPETLAGWNGDLKEELEKGDKIIVGFLVGGGFPVVTLEPKKNTGKTIPTEEVVKKSEFKEEKETLQKAEKEQEKIEEKEKKVTTENSIIPASDTKTLPVTEENGQGYFKASFELQLKKYPITKEKTVTSGIFKTSSGWDDRKFYLLVDGIPPGTIVKLTNPSNNMIVYAKVLGEMSGIRQNDGLAIRISNAAAAAMDIQETDKFILKMAY
jgi:hypothetical protein